MKNSIVFLLFLVNVSLAEAQYHVTSLGSFQYKILPDNSMVTWTDKDLVTWIFPDGQYLQEEVRLDGTGTVIPYSDIIQWVPSTTGVSGNILTHVAKKGGTGPPPMPMSTPVGPTQTSSTLAPMNFNGEYVKASNLWEFSPVDATLLVVSYKGACTTTSSSDYIDVSYNINEILVDSKFGYHSETFDPPTTTTQLNANNTTTTIEHHKVNTYPSNIQSGDHNSVYFKIRPKSTLPVGQSFQIRVQSEFCGATVTFDSTYTYVVQRGPHDPNSKIVNVETLYSSQTAPVELIYTVQFHNDGTAPVKKVVVTDDLPLQLDPSTFSIVGFQPMNGIDQHDYPQVNNLNQFQSTKVITFTGTGLPGLGQTDHIYAYGETIFRYKFKVKTKQGAQNTIYNKATVVFYNDNDSPLEQVVTSEATVKYIGPCPCCKSWWQQFLNIFRRDKKDPCKRRPQKEK